MGRYFFPSDFTVAKFAFRAFGFKSDKFIFTVREKAFGMDIGLVSLLYELHFFYGFPFDDRIFLCTNTPHIREINRPRELDLFVNFF